MEKKGFYRSDPIVLASFLVVLFTLPLMGGENSPQNDSPFMEEANSQALAALTHLTPLVPHSFLDSELHRLIQEKAHVREELNLAVKIFDSNSYFQRYAKSKSRSDHIENSLYTTSLVTLAALNAADYFTTMKALDYEGLREANPFMKPFTKNAALFAAVKVGLTAYHLHFMKNLYRKDKRLAWAVSLMANFVLSYIVANNLRMIDKAQGR